MFYQSLFKIKNYYFIAIASQDKLYVLKFVSNNYEQIIEDFLKKYKLDANDLLDDSNHIIEMTINELMQYFANKLHKFNVPLNLNNPYNTEFQNLVLKHITEIDYGTVISYSELAVQIKKPQSFRAVANACGSNEIVIIIPCHRVIAKKNKLGGYSPGIEIKSNLLHIEQS